MQGVMELATESEKVAPPYVEARLVKAFHCTAPGWIAGRSTLFSMEAECKYTFNSRCISGQNQSTLVRLQGVGMSTSFVAQMSHFNLSLGILPNVRTCTLLIWRIHRRNLAMHNYAKSRCWVYTRLLPYMFV